MVLRCPAHAAATLLAASPLLPAALAAQPHHPPPERPHIAVNDNRRPAGRLEGGVLTLRLVARDGTWYPEGEKGEGLPVAAWAEEGEAPLDPGPLIRVPEGTEIRATVRNALPGRTMTVHGLGERRGAPADSFRLAPGEVREVRFRAPAAGTYYYGATTGAESFLFRYKDDSQLNGAIVVDPPGAARPDRVFLISWWFEDADSTKGRREERGTMVINGRSWPHTERFHLAVGDTVRWRWINVTEAPHPMHLHGFYFRVDARGDAARDTIYAPADRRLAVTERLGGGETMALTWGPERPGNWVFHCHFAFHISHHLRLGKAAARPAAHAHAEPDSAGRQPHGMAGLVLGIHVAPGRAARAPKLARATRHMRLVVRSAAKPDGKSHAYAYGLEQDGRYAATVRSADTMALPGPTLVLERGQPVAITVVNRTHEPTAVHWHGIELESFPDGVPDWSGAPRGRMLQWLFPRPLLRPIAPGDSLTVRFTPPRSGTFMYHSHFNEMEQIAGGLYGAIVVLDSGARHDPATDHVVVLSADGPERTSPILVNGRADPAPIELRAGVAHRLRFINIFAVGGAPVALLDGETPVRWRAVAKDGADLPASQATARPARFRIFAGEIYDFELTPPSAADTLRLVVGAGPRARIIPVVVR